ncbi:MAG: molybdenum cofactor cytidylyltransferase [Deltaproteobacteria bacterium]|nr:molybdenum cofactor cytidylyltransferase [Deltaproteobacteria bacterium]
MLSAILLAAGESKRMGEPKQLMPLGKHTLLEQAIDNLLNSSVDETIVVVGHKAEEITRAIATKPVKIMFNPNYRQGMSTSIVAGLILVDPQSQAVMLALGDQPLVESQTINQLIDAFNSHDKGIAVPTHRGKRGNPIIFNIKYKAKLLELEGDIGGREIIRQHPGDVLEVAVDSESVISDIDTKDDYKSQLG